MWFVLHVRKLETPHCSAPGTRVLPLETIAERQLVSLSLSFTRSSSSFLPPFRCVCSYLFKDVFIVQRQFRARRPERPQSRPRQSQGLKTRSSYPSRQGQPERISPGSEHSATPGAGEMRKHSGTDLSIGSGTSRPEQRHFEQLRFCGAESGLEPSDTD